MKKQGTTSYQSIGRLMGVMKAPVNASSVETLVASALAVLIVFLVYVPLLNGSFWLDETVTAWVAQGNLSEALDKGFRFQMGSPIYTTVVWALRSVFPTSEVALRLPSLASAVIGAILLWRLGTRLFGRSAGLIAGILFAALPMVMFGGTDARPYMMALAALIASTLFLCRWIDDGGTWNQVLYAVLTASIFYLHYLVAIALLAQVPFFLVRRKEVPREVRSSETVRVSVLLGVLLLPAIPNVLYLLNRTSALEMPARSLASIVHNLFPASLVICLIGALVAAVPLTRRFPRWPAPESASGLLLGIGWALTPVVLLPAISAAGGPTLMIDRYFISSEPAIALCLAAAITFGTSIASRWICTGLGVLIFIVVIAPPPKQHAMEDWRAAGAAQRLHANGSTPTLLFAGLVEAKQVEYLTSPDAAAYLISPGTVYGMEGNIYPSPWDLTPRTEAYLQKISKEHLLTSDEFMVLTRGGDAARDWVDDQVAPNGFSISSGYNWGGNLILLIYQRESVQS